MPKLFGEKWGKEECEAQSPSSYSPPWVYPCLNPQYKHKENSFLTLLLKEKGKNFSLPKLPKNKTIL